ncbi:DNA-binding transcriptional MerR regulator [Enterococcus sp. PF1-24]|uniref:MerR family transcriptional regulator n=1 Tax=unclassified Enterococcus TaxID=2608891 RepID=UPI0024752556|nr:MULTISPECIES: MerR family transcriptional regulator [unclassified Enterococcus]MDH6364170.1 DNA-binding transcriptional MerR regulator [Enterococcus sp. PFB1-1]MDH6401271.1 DNA-binding transcriptional MerR regulator [Enterococcus sp. PF1-24]
MTEANQPAIHGNSLYKVGLFSKMNQITVKTLRHYDEVGILKPHYVDAETGYRYYNVGQLPVLHEIIALRRLGCSIEEIKQIQAGVSRSNLLQQKKQGILMEIANKTQDLAVIESYLAKPNILLEYPIVEKELPEIIVASRRETISNYGDLSRIMVEMAADLENLGCQTVTPEYCFNIYHDGEYKEDDIDVEICEAVTEMKNDSPQIKFKILPKIPKAICAIHKGSYDNLPGAFASVLEFIAENNYQIIGLPRESYIDGRWNGTPEEKWLTEIQFPVV